MTAGKVVLGLLTCVVAGAVFGILYAPQKGSMTRRLISNKGNEFTEELEEKFDDFIESITEKFDRVKAESARLIKKEKLKAEEAKAELTHMR